MNFNLIELIFSCPAFGRVCLLLSLCLLQKFSAIVAAPTLTSTTKEILTFNLFFFFFSIFSETSDAHFKLSLAGLEKISFKLVCSSDLPKIHHGSTTSIQASDYDIVSSYGRSRTFQLDHES